MFVNGGRNISNFVFKPNGGRNANEIIIEYIRDLFTVNDNFIIFLQNYIAPIPAWFIRHERWNSPPEFSIVTGAVFLKVSCERLFPQRDNFIAHTAIFIPVLLAVFLVFITDHVSLINSLSKFGVHIGDRLSFYQFSFNRGVLVYYIWQEFISEPDHIFYVVEHLAHMEWCTGDVIFVVCFHKIFVWSIEDMLWLLTWGKLTGRRSLCRERRWRPETSSNLARMKCLLDFLRELEILSWARRIITIKCIVLEFASLTHRLWTISHGQETIFWVKF